MVNHESRSRITPLYGYEYTLRHFELNKNQAQLTNNTLPGRKVSSFRLPKKRGPVLTDSGKRDGNIINQLSSRLTGKQL
jgi:hypothetical protein